MVLKSILKCFELVSCLKINFHKSNLGRIGVHLSTIIIYSQILYFVIMNILFEYLGIHVGANHSKKNFWIGIKRCLSKWKGKHIFFAGIVTLIKFVLSVMPIFYFSLLKLTLVV